MADDTVRASALGLELRAGGDTLAGSVALWGLLSGAAARWLGVPPIRAAAIGLGALGGHWGSVLWHHLGHAAAASGTGFPMRGIRFKAVFGTSLYPADEEVISATVHRRRALGGPFASLALAAVAGIAALALRRRGGLPLRFAQLLCLYNFFGLTLAAFLPLDFTDGGTLLRLRGQD